MATYREYCDNMGLELSGLRAKINAVVDRLDHISTGEKEKVVPEVFALHMIVEELSERIEGLASFCDTNWKAESREGMDSYERPRVIETSFTISQSDIGG